MLYCEVLCTPSVVSFSPMWTKHCKSIQVSLGEKLIFFSNLYFYKCAVNFEVNCSIPNWWNSLVSSSYLTSESTRSREFWYTFHRGYRGKKKKRWGLHLIRSVWKPKAQEDTFIWQVFHRVFDFCGKTKAWASGRSRAHAANPPTLLLVSPLLPKCSLKEKKPIKQSARN